jgi:hypothetical protein
MFSSSIIIAVLTLIPFSIFLACGVYHGFMPIVIESVSVQDYLAWMSDSQN